MDADGGNVRALSANYLNDFTPAVMPDGSILYSRWEYVDRPAIPSQGLWTINPDGTMLTHYYGNRVLSPATFMEARPIPGTTKILCVLTAHNGPCRGAIGIVDVRRGDNAQVSIQNLTPEVNIGRVDRGSGNHVRGPYESPWPLDDRFFLVSRMGTVLVRDYDGTAAATVLPPRDGLGFYSPRPVRPRRRPPVRASAPRTGGGETATVFVQNVYHGLAPHVKPGEVKRICVVQEIEKSRFAHVSRRAFGFQFPVVSCGATYAPKRVWGYADVAPDGSAAFRVPARVPIYFMAVDAEGRAVQRMRSFTHLAPGEVQGCVGCHEPRESAGRPGARPAAVFGRTPQDLEPPPWGVAGFSYARIVQPVLDRHCVKCHDARHPGKLDLSGDRTDYFNVSYEHLARQGVPGQNPYTKWIPSYNGQEQNILIIRPKAWGSPASKLADVVLSGHPGARGKPRIDLKKEERQRILTWIDLNVPYYGTSASNHYKRRGCRQMMPKSLNGELARVAKARCAGCHKGGRIPRQAWVRVDRPHLNPFLLAPLAKAAGGTGACGKAVFSNADDPDYKAILKTFAPVRDLLERTPRMDTVSETQAPCKPGA
jgi:hypothetical protein